MIRRSSPHVKSRRSGRRTFVPAAALAVAALWQATRATAQQSPLRDLDAYVAKAVQDWRVPGLAMAAAVVGTRCQ